ncbi:LCP family protein [Nocardioides sp. BP30]|uniref:LCP family protein n=1 Tax=Nocardioides sp. BP30 TaxID=3036374 RepID=UPI002469B812|nr:LCP family protein [Nocardioides sp. BP30]WGL53653.1 LCP family protein [Nocardioides sp. BP30]
MSQTGPMAPHHRRTVFTVIACTLLVLALATGTFVAVFYQHLDANLHAGQAIKHEVHKKQKGPKAPLNILVMGLDNRDCAGCDVDSESGADGSDTTILVHISADRKTAYGISIPRDALVKPVACTAGHHYTSRGVTTDLVQWNAAFTAGGADCTAEQLEKNFGIYVDGYITVNFGGFKGMVTALGGVNVCIPFELSDPNVAHITFEPGKSVHLNGPRALQYVRLRHVLDGSDIGRMKRQQYFISQMIDKADSAGTLTRPDKLVKFANALTGSITTSPNLASVKQLVKLAKQVKGIDLTNIRFITVPNAVYDVPTTDPYYGRVKILPAAKKLWKRVSNDKPLTKSLAAGAISAGGSGSATPSNSTSSSPSGTPSSTSSPSATTSAGSGSSSGSSSAPTREIADAAQYGLCS